MITQRIEVSHNELYTLGMNVGGISEAIVIVLRSYDIPVESYTDNKVLVKYGEITMTENEKTVLFEWKI